MFPKQVLAKTLHFEGAPLRLERKTEYITKKAEERKNKPAAPTTPAAAARPSGGQEAVETTDTQDAVKEEAAAPIVIPQGAHLRVCFEPDADLSVVTWRGIAELLGGRDAGVKHVTFKSVRGGGDIVGGDCLQTPFVFIIITEYIGGHGCQ